VVNTLQMWLVSTPNATQHGQQIAT